MTQEKNEPKIGDRVAVVSHADGGTLYVLGYGTFEGAFLPPTINVEEKTTKIVNEYQQMREFMPDLPETFTRDQARTALMLAESNPRILLTEGINTGKTVWGYECWWGDIETFNARSAGFVIAEADLDQLRAEREREAAELEHLAVMKEEFNTLLATLASEGNA